MNKTVYGLTGIGDSTIVLTPDQIPFCTTPGTGLTPQLLKSYIDRANVLLQTLADTRSPVEQTISRLDVIRQELCVLTGRPFLNLPAAPEIGADIATNGKITLQTTITS